MSLEGSVELVELTHLGLCEGCGSHMGARGYTELWSHHPKNSARGFISFLASVHIRALT